MNEEKPVNAGGEHEIQREDDGKFKKGVSANPKGKVKGTTNFSTDFRKAIRKIAKANDMSPKEAMNVLLRVGYVKASEGKFDFWKEVMEMVYGKPKQPLEHSGDIEVRGAEKVAKNLQDILNGDDKKDLDPK